MRLLDVDLVEPGMRLLETETGYGVVALGLAQALHGEGRLIAVNPDPLFVRSVADNGLQAVIETLSGQTQAVEPADGLAGFDLILLGATGAVEPRWLQPGDPLVAVPGDSAQVATLEAAGLGLYRLIPLLNALVAWSPEASERPATLFACNERRADWLRQQDRLIRPE